MTDADDDQSTAPQDSLSRWVDSQKRPARTLAELRADASTWLSVARTAAAIYAVLGVVGGVVLTTVKARNEYDSTHPYVGLGIGTAVMALFTAAVANAVLSYLTWRVAEAPA